MRIAIVPALLLLSGCKAAGPPAEAPVSVELPNDEIEIHCEIIKPV